LEESKGSSTEVDVVSLFHSTNQHLYLRELVILGIAAGPNWLAAMLNYCHTLCQYYPLNATLAGAKIRYF
jgi:hypothetical protein